MSIKAMEWVSSLTLGKASYKSVLTALSWIHHDKNDRCDPSIATLCEFTELNRKTVMAALSWLEKSALITPGKHRGTTTNYVLNMHETSPKNGTASRRDTSSNFGTGRNNSESPEVVPKTGPVPKTVPVPNLGPDQYQKRTKPVPNLDHDRVGSREKDKTLIRHDSKNEPYLKAARAMWDLIQPLTKQSRPPDFNTWAKDIRLLVERDRETPETVWRVFQWANRDPFWQVNILSPAKLRKQFGTLRAKMERNADYPAAARSPAGSTRRTSLEHDLTDTSWATGGSG